MRADCGFQLYVGFNAPIGGGSRSKRSIVRSAYGIGRLSLSTIPDGSTTLHTIGGGVMEGELVIYLEVVRVIEGVSVGVGVVEGGTPTVPAKL